MSFKAIQYAKAMKLRVIGIDISDSQLESARALGADLTFNSVSNPSYAEEILQKTSGGAHAAVVLSASNAAYQSAPNVLRWEVLHFQSHVLEDHDDANKTAGLTDY